MPHRAQVHAHLHKHVHTCIHSCIHAYMHSYIQPYTLSCMQTRPKPTFLEGGNVTFGEPCAGRFGAKSQTSRRLNTQPPHRHTQMGCVPALNVIRYWRGRQCVRTPHARTDRCGWEVGRARHVEGLPGVSGCAACVHFEAASPAAPRGSEHSGHQVFYMYEAQLGAAGRPHKY
jgi:hypothetical protein